MSNIGGLGSSSPEYYKAQSSQNNYPHTYLGFVTDCNVIEDSLNNNNIDQAKQYFSTFISLLTEDINDPSGYFNNQQMKDALAKIKLAQVNLVNNNDVGSTKYLLDQAKNIFYGPNIPPQNT